MGRRNITKKVFSVLMAVSLAGSLLCTGVLAESNGNSNHGHTGVTVHLDDETFKGQDITVTVNNGDSYTGEGKGSQISFDMGSENNTLKEGDKITVSYTDGDGNTTTRDYTIGRQEGNQNTEQDQGQNNYKAEAVKEGEGPKDEGPKDEDPEDEDPKDEDPKDEDPKDEDPEDEDPKDEDPEDEDPKDEDPKDEDPEDEDPKDEDPEDEGPKDEDPEDEDPKDEDPKDNTPKRSDRGTETDRDISTPTQNSKTAEPVSVSVQVDVPDEVMPQTETIPQEERPVLMAQPPKTGDLSGLFLGLSGLSGAGLVGVSLTGRKKREQE